MSLGDHLREFRRRLVVAAIAVVAGGVVGWIIYNTVYNILTAPITEYVDKHPDRAADVKLTLSGVTTAFSLHLSLAIFVGLILASPVWLYQVWAFIVPGLTGKEKRISVAFIGSAVPLFLLGLFIAHSSLPLVIGVLLDFTPKGAANFQQVSDYISFVTRFALGFGVAFLLPVFLIALNMIGVLPSRVMVKSWRVSVFLIFVFSAMMMPSPDPYSMMLLALPLVFLYFAAIGVAKLLERRKRSQRADWLETADDQASAI